MTILRAAAIGIEAYSLLNSHRQAVVHGVTSKGIFLMSPDQQVFFLSFENWRGPLTVNLIPPGPRNAALGQAGRFTRESIPFGVIENRDLVELRTRQILFNQKGIEISLENLIPWQISLDQSNASHPVVRLERLAKIAARVFPQAQGKGWTSLFEKMVIGAWGEGLADDLQRIETALVQIQVGLRTKNYGLTQQGFQQIVGRGSGLTPCGDDVIVGALLALSRMPAEQVGEFANLVGDLTRLAVEKTTALSAGLIRCAAAGQADERIISVLQHLDDGHLEEGECAERLLAYGSSSGVDSLLGMYLVFSVI